MTEARARSPWVRRLKLYGAGLLACSGVGLNARAFQMGELDFVELDYPHDTGIVRNEGAQRDVVASFVVTVEGAAWLHLAFDDVLLAGVPGGSDESILRLTAVQDGAIQELNAIHVQQWQRATAYFNGDTVLVEIVADPRSGDNRAVLGTVRAGAPPKESICGPTDDRLPSSDPRVARLLSLTGGVCTGFLVNDCQGCFLTAGHCTGSQLVAQFNVPPSDSGGSIHHPPPDDQYTVDPASVQSTGGGLPPGEDYAYLGTFPNPVTQLTARQAQGASFQLSAPPTFDPNDAIRITGHGQDDTPPSRNFVQQTHAGPWVGSAANVLTYQTDTKGGNSGSPIIHEPSGHAIGVHTHGGCQPSGPGWNAGGSYANPVLLTFLGNPAGVCSGSRVAPFTECWDHYATGSDPAGQGGWKYWPSGTPPRAVITEVRSRSAAKSVATSQGADLVREVDPSLHDSGQRELTAWQYLSSQPPDKLETGDSVWFVALSEYEPGQGGSNTWIVQVEFSGSGIWTIDAGTPGGSTNTGPVAFDRWVEIRAEADFDNDLIEVFYDGQSMAPPYPISKGVFGNDSGPVQLEAVDLYSPTSSSTSVGYYDDVVLEDTEYVTSYCTAKPGLVCGLPSIDTSGIPATPDPVGCASQYPFVVSAGPARGQQAGLLLYTNTGRASTPFQGGTLCTNAPISRTTPVTSTGVSGQCNGVFAIDFNAFARGALGGNPASYLDVPGQTINVQWWGRDSVATGSFLSDGAEFPWDFVCN